MSEKDPNDIEGLPDETKIELETPVDSEIKEIILDPEKLTEEEEEVKVQKLRAGFGRIKIIDKTNIEVFRYDYKIKTTDIKSVIEYLTTKYKDCRIEVLEW